MVKRSIQEQSQLYKVQTFHDRDAFGALYNTYVDDIYRFIAYKVPTRQDAEELTADVFLKVWEHLTNKKNTVVRGFRAFLYQTARNTVIDWYRKKSNNNEIATEMHQLQCSEDSDITEQTDKKIAFDSLLKVLDELKSEYKEVLILKYIEELSTAEIATVLGKKKTAVRVTLHRATKHLQERITEQQKPIPAASASET